MELLRFSSLLFVIDLCYCFCQEFDFDYYLNAFCLSFEINYHSYLIIFIPIT